MTTSKARHSRSQRGAALVEFALSLPLLGIFIAGIYDLGRVQSQVNTLSQMAYQIAIIGATSPKATGNTAMETQGARILSLANKQMGFFDGAPILEAATGQPATRYFSENSRWYVNTTVTGSLNSYFKFLFPNIFQVKISVTAPYLYSANSAENENIDGYQDNAEDHPSDCEGRIDGSARSDEGDCRAKICGCPAGTSAAVCLGTNTPRICYERTMP